MPLHLNNLKPLPKARREWADALLTGWNTLNAKLVLLAPDQVHDLLSHELLTRRRLQILGRLVTRLSKLEARQNQAELMSAVARLSEDDT